MEADERYPLDRTSMGEDGGNPADDVAGTQTIHHSIAYLVLNNDADAVNTGTATGGPDVAAADDLVNRRPQLMEWAIGKGYDLFRADTGKLIVPGEKISWDQHIHAVGEPVTSGSEIGIWFYPKGQEPKHRTYLIGFSGINKAKGLDIAPNSIAHTEGFTVLKENTIITNFQPHFHLRGKAMQVEAILPDGSRQVVSYIGNFNFNWMTNYIYADDAAPAFPKGTVIHVTRVARQHEGQQVQSGSGSVGRLRRPHGGRDGPRLDERRVYLGRRVQGLGRRAQTEAAVAESAVTITPAGGSASMNRWTVARLYLALTLATGVLAAAQQLPSEPRQTVRHERDRSI